jgi:hypothetical protein
MPAIFLTVKLSDIIDQRSVISDQSDWQYGAMKLMEVERPACRLLLPQPGSIACERHFGCARRWASFAARGIRPGRKAQTQNDE